MANYPTEYGTSPVGRIIMHPREGLFAKGTTNQNNQPVPLDKQKYFVGLAIEKNAPGVNEMLGDLQRAAIAAYQSNSQIMAQINMGLAAPNFSWKVQDGDEMVQNPETGQMEPRTPHGKGCWVFKFSTTIDMQAAKCIPGQHTQPVYCDQSELYKGCYAQISYSTSANGNLDHTAGVYLNPRTICLVGYGDPITAGPTLEQQFPGGTPAYTPAGMSTTPVGNSGQSAGMGGGGMPQQNPMGGGMPQQNPMGGGMPQQNPMGMGGGMPQQNPMGGGMPQQNPNGMPQQPPNGMPQQPPNGMPQQPPNGMPQQNPNAGAGYAQGGMPQNTAPQYPSNPMGGNAQQPPNNMNNGGNMGTSSPSNGGGMPAPGGNNAAPGGYGGYMNNPG